MHIKGKSYLQTTFLKTALIGLLYCKYTMSVLADLDFFDVQ